jgi:hypothetical protein
MANPIVARHVMKHTDRHSKTGRSTWVIAAIVAGVTLCGAAISFHGTKTASHATVTGAAREGTVTATAGDAVTPTLPIAARPVPIPLQVEAPSPINTLVSTAPESIQVESSTDEHAGRSKESEQTPAWKGEKTRAIWQVVSGRVERVEKEAAELERAGDVQAAASQRLLLARLKRQVAAMNDEMVAYAKADAAERR